MDKETIIKKITRWCAYQERSEYETVQKLISLGIDNKIIEQIIQYLKEENYLNEQRFVNTFINGKMHSKKWGIEKIRYYLKQKHHVDERLIHQAFGKIDNHAYLQRLEHIILKKKQSIEKKVNDRYVLKKKIINFALSKGYNISEIIQVLDELNI